MVTCNHQVAVNSKKYAGDLRRHACEGVHWNIGMYAVSSGMTASHLAPDLDPTSTVLAASLQQIVIDTNSPPLPT